MTNEVAERLMKDLAALPEFIIGSEGGAHVALLVARELPRALAAERRATVERVRAALADEFCSCDGAIPKVHRPSWAWCRLHGFDAILDAEAQR